MIPGVGSGDNPAMVEEVTKARPPRSRRFYRENPPEFIYFLTLYSTCSANSPAEDDEDNGIRPGLKFEESVVWSKLYDFRRTPSWGAIRKPGMAMAASSPTRWAWARPTRRSPSKM